MELFIISEAICGAASSKLVRACNMVDVKRMMLIKEYTLETSLQLLKLVSKSINIDLDDLLKLKNLSNKEIIATLIDQDVNSFYDYIFTAGYGQQEGNPGKEWMDVSIQPLNSLTQINAYEHFNSTDVKNELRDYADY